VFTPLRILTLLMALLLLYITAASSHAYAGEQARRRFAMIVGANDGGPYRIKLRYAASDARAMQKVFEELGGIPEKNQVFLENPELPDFYRSYQKIQIEATKSKEQGDYVELFFYYSGHSDDEGLLLYGKHLAYRELKQMIDAVPADVRVVILDSCQSGAMTRSKGGSRQAPFMSDSSVNLKGHAFLTSSAADEAAQESDRIGGSFFTHYMVSGLRGAADSSGDRRVSLNEAYQYAFNETLRRTETAQSGAQHPTYEIKLSGTGELVLTDLNETSSSLRFSQPLSGRVYVRDESGRLVAELDKPAEREIELGVAPGRYHVILDNSGDYYESNTMLALEASTELSEREFQAVDSEETVTRGLDNDENIKYTHVPFNIGLFPPAQVNKAFKEPVLNNVSLGLLATNQGKLEGFGLGLILSWEDYDLNGLQIAGISNVTQRDAVGVSIGGIVNVNGRDSKGLQIAGIYNHNGRHFAGAQWGLVNYTGGNFTGGQFALANFAVGNFIGAQLSLASVTIDNVTGFQAGLTNITVGDVTGAQASFLNVSTGRIYGVQWSYLNIATGKEMSKGAEFGFMNINIGRLRGAQFGFVNYSEYADAPIGFLSIVRDGVLRGRVWTSDTSLINVGLRHGSKYVYNVYHIGFQPVMDTMTMSYGLTLGAHVPASDNWFVEFEFDNMGLSDITDFTRSAWMSKFGVVVGWKWDAKGNQALLFGPTLNVLTDDGQDKLDSKYMSYIPLHKAAEWDNGTDANGQPQQTELYLGPGFMVGYEF